MKAYIEKEKGSPYYVARKGSVKALGYSHFEAFTRLCAKLALEAKKADTKKLGKTLMAAGIFA